MRGAAEANCHLLSFLSLELDFEEITLSSTLPFRKIDF